MTCDGISRRNVLAFLGLGALSLAAPVVLTERLEAQPVVAPSLPTGTEQSRRAADWAHGAPAGSAHKAGRTAPDAA